MRPGGSRAFDADFMANVYERPFEVVACGQAPEEKSESKPVGRHLEGCRIVSDSDAHYLEHIHEPGLTLPVEEKSARGWWRLCCGGYEDLAFPACIFPRSIVR